MSPTWLWLLKQSQHFFKSRLTYLYQLKARIRSLRPICVWPWGSEARSNTSEEPNFSDALYSCLFINVTLFSLCKLICLFARIFLRVSLWAGRSADRIPVEGARFFVPVQPGPGSPPSFLYNGYRVFPGGIKRPGRGADHPSQFSAEVKERVKIYFYSPSGPSLPVLVCTELYRIFAVTHSNFTSWLWYHLLLCKQLLHLPVLLGVSVQAGR
jgi:hypothetical protein